MHALEFKAVLHRANPAVIRQFTMPDDFSAELLQQVMSVLFGWSKNAEWMISFDDSTKLRNVMAPVGKYTRLASSTANDNDKIKNALQAGRILFLHPSSYSALVFRVSFVGETEQTQTYPVVTHFRGYNIPEDIGDLDTFNRLQLWWKKRSYSYYSQSIYSYDQDKYFFMKETAERELRKLIPSKDKNATSSVLDKLNYSCSIPVERIIGAFRVKDIRDIAKNEGIRIPSGLNRDSLIDYVSAELGHPSIFEKHIRYMSLAYYDSFQRFCMTECQEVDASISYDVMHDLYCCGLAEFYEYGYGKNHGFSAAPSTELLRNYEGWLLDDKEKDFLKKAKIRSTIVGSVRLYGFIKKSTWMRISSSWIEKELSYLNISAQSAWDDYFAYIQKTSLSLIGVYGDDYLYDKSYIDERTMPQIIRECATTARYKPDFEQLAVIEARGLYFEGEDRKRLEDIILRNINPHHSDAEKGEEAEEIGRTLYHIMRCNPDRDILVDEFVDSVYASGKKTIDEFNELADYLETKVRRIEYAGHTAEEFMPPVRSSTKQSGGASKQAISRKVYPNEPCPCGSGKKYKNCHGSRKL